MVPTEVLQEGGDGGKDLLSSVPLKETVQDALTEEFAQIPPLVE